MTLVAAECQDTDVRGHNPFDQIARNEGCRRPNPDRIGSSVFIPFFCREFFGPQVFGSKELVTFSHPVLHQVVYNYNMAPPQLPSSRSGTPSPKSRLKGLGISGCYQHDQIARSAPAIPWPTERDLHANHTDSPSGSALSAQKARAQIAVGIETLVDRHRVAARSTRIGRHLTKRVVRVFGLVWRLKYIWESSRSCRLLVYIYKISCSMKSHCSS
jgi:hypothetical protein